MASTRKKLFSYIEKKYKASPEYLWARYPGYVVFRHGDNRKWFALIMDISAGKLGLDSDEIVDVLNVKMSDPLLADYLVGQKGYFRGYHISKGNWISILMDGSVAFEEIGRWVEESYFVTASRETKNRLRPPKEWIVPANPKYYDIEAAFSEADEINWKQGKGIRTGDVVFIYVAAPVSAILYKCRVTETDTPYRFDNGEVRMISLMRIKLLKRYRTDQFTFETLGREYGIFAVRGPRGIPESLSEALNSKHAV